MVYLAAALVLITAGALLAELFRGERKACGAAVVVVDSGESAQVMELVHEEEASGRRLPVIILAKNGRHSEAACEFARMHGGIYLASDAEEIGKIAEGECENVRS
ncbi:hypothetical protein [uncultured Ruminococcus sp.]|uniref:hypothetical protein n=1 Tax=uncultured Ruminococcus sp. TaxID=165186 RepID=UPI0025DE025C|nr:hypothetical protein [uncultured Ruminococcus sp.]